MDIENLGATTEKKASSLKELHEKALELLASNKAHKGITLLKSIVSHPYVTENLSEFRSLLGSSYYNLSMFYDESSQPRKSIYFLFKTYLLYPTNTDYLLKLSVNCKKEGFLPQAIYFFELTKSLTKSEILINIYTEEIILLNYYLDNFQ
jgi:hypothetical protein